MKKHARLFSGCSPILSHRKFLTLREPPAAASGACIIRGCTAERPHAADQVKHEGAVQRTVSGETGLAIKEGCSVKLIRLRGTVPRPRSPRARSEAMRP